MRERAPTPREQVLSTATKRAIGAAGGLEDVEKETVAKRSQLSRCCNPALSDSITIRDAVTVDDMTHGAPGFPNIVRAMARQLNCLVIEMPSLPDDPAQLQASLLCLTVELGDVAREIGDALRDGEVSRNEAQRVLAQIDELDAASAQLRAKLMAITAKGARK